MPRAGGGGGRAGVCAFFYAFGKGFRMVPQRELRLF